MKWSIRYYPDFIKISITVGRNVGGLLALS